jgi:hypothetical protein
MNNTAIYQGARAMLMGCMRSLTESAAREGRALTAGEVVEFNRLIDVIRFLNRMEKGFGAENVDGEAYVPPSLNASAS